MKISEITDFKEEYNALIDHPLQTWQWGETREGEGIPVLRLGVFEGDKMLAWYQMSLHKIPHTKYTVGYVPRSHLPKREHLDLIKFFAKKKNIVAVAFEPIEEPSTDFFSSDFKKSFTTLLMQWTQVLDLSKSKEQLLADMKQQARYNINYASRKGVVVKEETSEQGFQTFWNLYQSTQMRQGSLGHSYKHHKIIFDILSRAGIAKIFIAYHEDKPLCVFETFVWKDTLYYPYGGSDRNLQNFKGQNLGIWELALYGQSQGLKKFDLWGSLPPVYDEKHHWAGFTMFKESFGTEFVKSGETYDLIVFPFLYQIYKVLFLLRKMIFPILKKFRKILYKIYKM